jgi:dolichol kinase
MPDKRPSRPGIVREEIFRKSVHVGCGIAISVLYSMYQKNLLITLLLISLSFVFCLEVLRLKGMLTVPLLRDMEKKKIGAYAFFMMGAFMSILLFAREIAIASILMLAIGDAASGIAQSIKRGTPDILEGHRRGIKPLDEILIMFGVSSLVGYFVVGSLPIAVCGAVGAAIADGVHLKIYDIVIDDNLTIPLYSGLLMSLAALAF